MKRIISALFQFGIVIGLITVFLKMAAFADSALPFVTDVYEQADIPIPPEASGQEITKQLVFGALAYVKTIAAVIGILFITIMGFRLVIAQGNEEDITTARRGLIYSLIAFVLISMSQDLAKVFDMSHKTLLQDPSDILQRVHIFDKQVEIFVVFVKYVIGAYAALMAVRAAIGLITSGGNEEETTKNKKGLLFSGAGLILIYVGDIFINRVFYKVDKDVYTGISGVEPGVDAAEGVRQVVGITNLVVSVVGPIAVLMLIIGAVMYATAGGEEENLNRAKRLIVATIIGIVIIFGAFALVSTVIGSKLNDAGALLS